ncbi:unnamed protein product [Rotaria magnacalcarata]|uniref:E3 ubiquitin-protein ligase n=3 Tax=Rotaria magnacalcarata TaxID=392030 RepID=A0A816SLW9_9BILA|nr:unnamed protein product [Rotaria magnacalcarata]CAF2085331.1 unnamed protein product [Rotaria magnacalcarata]
MSETVQSSSDTHPPESLSELRVKICSVRLPSSTKLVDICVIMEIDNKYPYRTEIIHKKGKSNMPTNSVILINECFNTLVTLKSKINFKIHAPTRRFGNTSIGQIDVNLKSIIDDYYLNEENNNTDTSPSHHVRLTFQNSTSSSSSCRLNDPNDPSTGVIDVIFYGSILKQQQNGTVQTSSELDQNANSQNETSNQQSTSNPQVIQSRQHLPTNQINGATALAVTPIEIASSPISETLLAQLKQQLPTGWEIRIDTQGRPYYVDHNRRRTTWLLDQTILPPGWEERVDGRGRVYFVDHNTRTTTWIRPTAMHLSNVAQWQNQYARSHSMFNQFEHRFLPQTENDTPVNDTPVNDSNEEPLPEGWQRMFDNQGRPYFVNHLSKTTQWEDPRQMSSNIFDVPLPDGFEMCCTKEGQIYFLDHNKNTKTLQDPRLECSVANAKCKRSLPYKIRQFRYLCSTNATNGQLKLTIRRDRLFNDSFNHVVHFQSSELRRRLYLSFKHEEALDYGGVAREWFFRLSHEVLNPMYCLFEYANKNNYYLQINPASSINPDHLVYFGFIGRFVAMALYHEKFIDNGFSLPFYKRMLGKTLTINDLQSLDPEFYNSLLWIKDNNLDENDDLELYFNTTFELLGKVENVELKPGGNDIKLTEANKVEYLELITQWRFTRGVEEQTKAFLHGFNEVVPLQWIQMFDERELELLLCGISKIDVVDWERNTIYKHYTQSTKQIQWFWQFVREITDEQRARLLQFVTGTCRVPIGGFSELLGSNGPQKFCIEKYGKDNILPRSHTCFNRLDLPPYKKYEILKEKLLFAIEECEGFGQE